MSPISRKRANEGVMKKEAGQLWGRRIGLLTTAAALALGTPSCSFIVDKNADQCEVDADCAGLDDTDPATPPARCTAEKVCSTSAAAGCQTTEECVTKNADNFICRRSDRTCVPLLTAECSR